MCLFNGGRAEKWALSHTVFQSLPVYGIAKATTLSIKLVNMKEILMRSLGACLRVHLTLHIHLLKLSPMTVVVTPVT